MADLPFTPAAPGLAELLLASLDREGKIGRALAALGPIADRDVLLVDGGQLRASELAELGARVRTVAAPDSGTALDAPDGSVDVVVGLWSAFRAPGPEALADVDRVLRPEGRLLVVQDYGRDDVCRLRGELPEHGAWSRRDGPYLAAGFRIRVIHCFWTFGSLDDARTFLGAAFGPTGEEVGRGLQRPRITYNVAIYHRSRGGARPAS
jgi:SAM-dependent methyltransferase